MKTKRLMIASSATLAVAGGAASFAPAELAGILGIPAAQPVPVIFQLLGALYLAFAITNWTAKDNAIGGIYSRPLSLGNFLHFAVGALALAKQQATGERSILLLAVLFVYMVFSLLFGWLLFRQGAAIKAAA